MSNTIVGTSASEFLIGTTGDDQFFGGGGNDTMTGGLGNDTYAVYVAGAVVNESAGGGTDDIYSYISYDISSLANVENIWLVGGIGGTGTSATGNASNNSLSGNTLNNTLFGGAGADTLYGREGNDVLDGGSGADSLYGGAGDDVYYIDNIGDSVVENAGEGSDIVYSSVAGIVQANFANIESWQFTGSGGFSYTGTSGNDTYLGGNGKDTISGLSGDDALDGADGDDTIDGGAGNDSLTGGAGSDCITGGTGIDTMVGGAGNDSFSVDDSNDVIVELSADGSDTITSSVSYALSSNVENLIFSGTGNFSGIGNSSDNVITGNTGNNVLDGSAGADTLIGGAGDDTYYIDNLLDVVTEGISGGTDTVYYLASLWPVIPPVFANVEAYISLGSIIGTPGADLLNGDLIIPNVNDTISGLGGNDTVNGLGGNDSLDGGAGDDSLTGGAGFDTLVGGTGNDTYVIDVTAPDKVVEDTLVGSGTDRIEANGSFSIADPVNPPIGQAATGEFSGIEQLFYAGAAGVTLTGNALRNTLQSDLGNDCLVGGAGNDTMIGGAGNDTYVLEGAEDVIIEVAGGGTDQANSVDDLILPFASEVENILLLGNLPVSAAGSSSNNYITGNSADNALRGELGDDTLVGNAGNDLLDGGLGADCLVGGAGNDTYILDAIAYPDGSIRTPDTIVENSGEGTDEIRVAAPVDLSLLANFENVTLQDGGDFEVIGNASSNVLKGNSGNNVLDGGTGNDTLIGGAGNDSYILDSAGDIVQESLGDGTDSVVSYLDTYTLPTNVENLDVKGGSGSSGIGNTAPNVITGNQFDNTLKGLGGADTLAGGLGNDCLDGGNDERLYDQTEDSLVGSGGDDTYMVDNYQDVVVENPGEGRDKIELYPTLLSLALTDTSYTYSINRSSFTTSATAGTHVQFYLDKLQAGELNYNPAASVPDDTAPALGSFELDGNYFYAMPDNIEDLTLKSKAVVVNGGQFLIGPRYAYGNAEGNSIIAISDLSVADDLPFSNYIDGQGGDDTMAGGLGSDTYIVDSSLDVVFEQSGEGTDLVFASTNYDLSSSDIIDPNTLALTSTVENLTLLDSIETIVSGRPVLTALAPAALDFNGYGNSAANVISGNAGNNSLTGAAGNDTIFGGGGNDSIDGGTGNDNIDGGDGNDSLVGGVGNDSLVGGAGSNTLVGGSGDDTYVVASLADSILESPAEGTDLVRSSVNFSLFPSADIENLTLTGAGDINGTGNVLGNVITGNSGSNLIDGGAGIDTMLGGAGDDTFVVSEVGDVVSENLGGGTDEVQAWVNYDLSTSPNIENLTLLGTAVSGIGNAIDNVITGNALGNVLNGGGAVLGDTLVGGVGDDTYMISNNLDVIIEAAGDAADEVISSAANYTLADNVENLTLLAGAGNINGTGNNYDNLITGNPGNNILDGGAGDNTLVGGLGNDTYVVASEFETIVENPGEGADEVQTTSSYTLGANLENLRLMGAASDNLNGWGNSLDNQLVGDGGDNLLFGYAGNDSLDGGLGNDTMVGGFGNDTYVVAQAGDVVAENLNQGTDLVQAGLTYTLGNNVENLTLTGAGNINGTGNTLNNIITGNDGDNILDAGVDTALGSNTLVGGLGNDTLVAGLGNDCLDGGVGNDNLSAGDGANALSGGSGDDTLLSGTGNDTLDGGEGNDSLTAGNGNNSLAGGLGNDSLLAGTGADTLDGGAGNDSLDGGTGADAMIGGTGNDTYMVDNIGDTASETTAGGSGGTDIVSSSVSFTVGTNIENLTLTGAGNTNGTGNSLGNVIAGNAGNNLLDGLGGRDTIDGGLGNDSLLGGALQDSLTGGAGNDSLDGGTEDDFLTGTSGALAGANELDTLTGGTGGDAFVLGNAASTYYDTAANGGDYALITDFSAADNDQLQLKTLAASGSNVNGYVVGANIYAAAGAANSWLYRDVNSNSAADAGDNLIAAIQATGGTGAGGALTTADLNTVGYFV